MFAYAPVIAGAWQQHQVWDGTYNYDDLLDWHEMQSVKNENERRVQEYSKTQGGMNE
jgi:hypothetical protein